MTAGLVFTNAGAASAATASGFRSCSVNYVVKLATVTSGYTSVNVGAWREARTLGSNVATNWYSNVHSGTWGVNAPTVGYAAASCA